MAITSADIAEAEALADFLTDRAEALGRRIGLPVVAALTTDDNVLGGTITPDAAAARDHSVTTAYALARLTTELRALAAGVDGDLTITPGATALTLAATRVVATPPLPVLLAAEDGRILTTEDGTPLVLE